VAGGRTTDRSRVQGRGAWSGDCRLTASTTTQLREAIVAIGDYATGPGAPRKNETQLAATVSLTPRVHRIRMLGTAALDLAWVAAGRLDASITFSNHPWDMAAGIIIAREAGAAVTDADGTPHTMTSAATIAAAPALISQLVPLIQTASQGATASGDDRPAPSSPYADLDAILSRARYLIFDFDGPVRDPATGTPAGYIHEALVACRDSGRIPAITAATSTSELTAYLARHGLDELVRHVYALNGDRSGHGGVSAQLLRHAISILETKPSDCAVITATAATLQDAHHTGLATIGYAAAPGADELLTNAGADSLLPSLADLTLRLRARPLPN
jgi:beta-phosphoglucomutase-like phosphatase (HAD superfamily)